MSESLCLVIPIFNEQDTISRVVNEWLNLLTISEIDFHIILINDGSTDNSLEIINTIASREERIIIINQSNQGHGASIIEGYKKALYLETNWIFQCDADDQIPISNFQLLWESRNTSQLTIGFRQYRRDPLTRIIGSKVLNMLINLIFKKRIVDANCPFRIMSNKSLKSYINTISLNQFAPNIFITIFISIKYSVNSIPVSHKERITGIASLNIKRVLIAALITLKDLFIFRLRINK